MDDSMNKIIAEIRFGIAGAAKDLEMVNAELTAKQARALAILQESQAKQTAILAKGEAEREAILARGKVAESEARKQAIIAESNAKIEVMANESANKQVLAREKADAEIIQSAERTAATVAEINARTGLTGVKANIASEVGAAQVAQVEAKTNAIVTESEAKKVATTAKSQAEISAIVAKEALTRQSIIKAEAQAELLTIQQVAAKEKLAYMQARSEAFSEKPNLIARHTSWFLTGALLFEGYDLLKQSLVDVETGMKGLQTVIPELAHDQEAYNKTSKEAIDLMQKYGAELDETMTAARSFGRMYKDIETVMGLTNNAILLNVIDQVALEDATKGNEAALSTYGDALKNTNEVLAFSGHLMDSITNLSHNTLATGTDLINILQQTSSAAKQANTDLDELLGTGAAAIRATGLQGQGGNIGRALRTVFTQLSAPTQQVEKEINDIGVSLRDLDTGQLRSAYDIILDLSLATKDAKISQEDLNEALLKAASGKFQYNKLSALVGQFDDIVKNTAISINSQGRTAEMAGQQLDTLSRKAGQVKATLIDMFSDVGDSGLRQTLKDILDVINQFLMGINSLNKAEVVSALKMGGMILAGRMLIGVFRSIYSVFAGVTGGVIAFSRALSGATIAAEGATVAVSALDIATKGLIGALTAGLSIGTMLAAMGFLEDAYAAGEAEKAANDLTAAYEKQNEVMLQRAQYYQQETSFLESMKEKYQDISKELDNANLSEEQRAVLLEELKSIQEAVILCLDDEAKAQIDLNNINAQTIDQMINLVIEKKKMNIANLQLDISDQQSAITATNVIIESYKKRLKAIDDYLQAVSLTSGTSMFAGDGSLDMGGASVERAKLIQEIKSLDAANAQAQKDVEAKQGVLRSLMQDLDSLKTSSSGGGGDSGSGGGGGSGGSSSNLIEDYIKAIERETELQVRLNDANQRAIDIQNAQIDLHREGAMTIEEYTSSLKMESGMLGAYRTQQEGLHKEADLYRAANVKLREAQANLNTETAEGQESFDKLSDAIEKNEQKIAEAQKSWLSFEKTIRGISGKEIRAMIQLFNDMDNLGIDMSDEMGALLSSINLANYSWQDQLSIIKDIKDFIEEELTDAVDVEINAIESAQQAYDDAADAKIASIQSVLDALDEEATALQEQQEIEDAQASVDSARNDLSDAKTKLANAQKEKNTRIFQNGRWDYIADPAAVRDAQKEVQDAQEALLNARRAFNDKMDEINAAHEKKELEAKIAKIQKEKETQDAAFEKAKQDKQAFVDETVKQIMNGDKKAFADALTQMFESEGGITPTIKGQLDILGEMVTQWTSAQAAKIASITMQVGGGSSGSGSYATGISYLPEDQMAQLHKGEAVLTAKEVTALGGKSGVDRLKELVRIPNFKTLNPSQIVKSSSSSSVDKSMNFHGDFNFPQIYDAGGLIRNLKQLAS